ncbi:hypothetical protein BKA70DRAFT_1241913 [Coprinopsis sp. MPI-PUGE-AT-0042]|nr:hypothetical protein BKA70DRAFT_1241913 [Coprinopsis sp. MPI-PUGE-AT-0042]
MSSMVDAYMLWRKELGGRTLAEASPGEVSAGAEGYGHIIVIDIFYDFSSTPARYSYTYDLVSSDANIPAALLRRGLVPSSPLRPKYCVTVRTLDIFRTMHLRCPSLTTEPFTKSLCDIYRFPYSKPMAETMMLCYETYSRLREEATQRTLAALQRDQNNWRRRNACVPCTYWLQEEPKLLYNMLITMDGNDSLKRVIRRDHTVSTVDGGGKTLRGACIEREDSRVVRGDYYLSRTEGDRWSKTNIEGIRAAAGQVVEEEEEEDTSPCEPRWKNMSDEATARSWGIFDETGIFLTLYRHGHVFVLMDMVQSGELSKYPLAASEAVMDAYGSDVLGGFDTGCRFKKTLAAGPLGPKAKAERLNFVVGSFHGHARNRQCQLVHLPTYVKGIGLSDLKMCEHFFAKSNALASSIRHASIFHQRQKIHDYVRHIDEVDTAQSLSENICRLYKRALGLIAGEAALHRTMAERGIANGDVFLSWLAEEKVYLENLQHKPIEDTLRMDYSQALVNMRDHEFVAPISLTTLATLRATFIPYIAGARSKAVQTVHNYERRLEITDRWTAGTHEWVIAQEMASHQRYRKCLDELEALIVSRMFELTKMNMARTALQVRSKAIRAALDRYNDAAKQMLPPRPQLTWDQIVNYTFLADFDLLCDSREDIRKRPWAQPANRILMDEHFKIERAHEELIRLNIEIKRIITHIQDEENYLLEAEENAATSPLGYFIQQYRLERTRFSCLHLVRFSKLSNQLGFTGSLVPGKVLDKSRSTTTFPSQGPTDEEPSEFLGTQSMSHRPRCGSVALFEDPMDVEIPPIIQPLGQPSTVAENVQISLSRFVQQSTPVATQPTPSTISQAQASQTPTPLISNPEHTRGFTVIQYLPLHLSYNDLGDEDADGETNDGGIGDIDADGESDNDDVEYLDFAFTSYSLL